MEILKLETNVATFSKWHKVVKLSKSRLWMFAVNETWWVSSFLFLAISFGPFIHSLSIIQAYTNLCHSSYNTYFYISILYIIYIYTIYIYVHMYGRFGYIVRDHHDTMIDCLEQISTINVRIDFIIEKWLATPTGWVASLQLSF